MRLPIQVDKFHIFLNLLSHFNLDLIYKIIVIYLIWILIYFLCISWSIWYIDFNFGLKWVFFKYYFIAYFYLNKK